MIDEPTHAELDADRDTDRELRARIDPLVGQLSALGKFELATRLMGEMLLAPSRRRRQPAALVHEPVLHAVVVRELPSGEDEGGPAEAPVQSRASLDTEASAADGDGADTRTE